MWSKQCPDAWEIHRINSIALMECTYSHSLYMSTSHPWLWKARRPEEVKNRKLEMEMTARKLKACLNSKRASWTKAGNDNKKGCKQKFHVSTYHFNSFFQINCLTSFETSWVTTNMSINENVTKEKKTSLHYSFQEASEHFQPIHTLKRKDCQYVFWFFRRITLICSHTALHFKLLSNISV